MDFLELAGMRQSCRDYSPRSVPREALERCFETARVAPSACNSQPWRFLAVESEPLRSQLAEKAFHGIYAINRFALKAPVLIVVVTERSKYVARLGGTLRGIQYALVDIGIACQHFDLAAAEQGLGCCWLGWFDEKGVKQVLGLPRSDRVDIMLSVGYPTDSKVRPKNRKTLDEIRKYI